MILKFTSIGQLGTASGGNTSPTNPGPKTMLLQTTLVGAVFSQIRCGGDSCNTNPIQ
jgi:hypothetical protein